MMLSGCTVTVIFEGVTSKGSPYLVTSGASYILCSISVKGRLWPIYSTVLVTCPTSVKETLWPIHCTVQYHVLILLNKPCGPFTALCCIMS